jgi:hypothetical protein
LGADDQELGPHLVHGEVRRLCPGLR